MSYEKLIEEAAKQHLVGKRITGVRYLTAEESDESVGWGERGVVIELEGGIELLPMRDDEGNGPGALATNIENPEILSLFAVIR